MTPFLSLTFALFYSDENKLLLMYYFFNILSQKTWKERRSGLVWCSTSQELWQLWKARGEWFDSSMKTLSSSWSIPWWCKWTFGLSRVRKKTPGVWRILTYPDVCWRMLTYVDVSWRKETYVDVCWRMSHADDTKIKKVIPSTFFPWLSTFFIL